MPQELTKTTSQPVDTMAPWTIKSFSTEARRRLVRHAEVAGITVGQFIEQLLEAHEAAGSPTRITTGFTNPPFRSEVVADVPRIGQPRAPSYSPVEELQALAALDPRVLDDEAVQKRLKARVRRLALDLNRQTASQTAITPLEAT